MEHEDGDGDKMILRLNTGEEVVSSIVEFCEQNNITGGWVTGLGTLSLAELSVYNLKDKKYERKTFSGPHELLNLTGNIGLLDDKKVTTHIHITVADNAFVVHGGHLDRAIVGATCEIQLEIFEHPINRSCDEKTGLNLIN